MFNLTSCSDGKREIEIDNTGLAYKNCTENPKIEIFSELSQTSRELRDILDCGKTREKLGALRLILEKNSFYKMFRQRQRQSQSAKKQKYTDSLISTFQRELTK